MSQKLSQMPLDKLENINAKFSLLKSLRYVLDAFDTLNVKFFSNLFKHKQNTKPSQNFLESLYLNLNYKIQPLDKEVFLSVCVF